jgi:hypothetical protein
MGPEAHEWRASQSLLLARTPLPPTMGYLNKMLLAFGARSRIANVVPDLPQHVPNDQLSACSRHQKQRTSLAELKLSTLNENASESLTRDEIDI